MRKALLLILPLLLGCISLEHQEQASPTPVVIPAGCGLISVHVINVSQADSIFIITPGNKTILIDAGSAMKPNSSTNVVEFLRNMNISRIDYLLVSHYHEDHLGGMEDVFSNFEVGKIYDNGNCGNYSSGPQRKFQALASSHEFIHVSADMEIEIDSCLSESRLIVAYDRPEGCWDSSRQTSSENDNSVLLKIAYGNTSLLFTGDCEGPCEQELLSQGTNISASFLKVGHHGSATSSSPPFLAAVGAELFAISTDRNRSVTDGYYHPRQIPLGNLYAQGAREGTLFRTDLDGDVEVISNGTGMAISAPVGAGECGLFSGYNSTNISTYGPIPPLSNGCG